MISTGPSVRPFLRFLTERKTLLISAPFSRGLMSVFSNVITPQGLEPLQFPTKFRSHSIKARLTLTKVGHSLEGLYYYLYRTWKKPCSPRIAISNCYPSRRQHAVFDDGLLGQRPSLGGRAKSGHLWTPQNRP